MSQVLNWIDFFVVFPYFFILAIDPGKVKQFGFLRIFRLGRSVRLIRISKHSKHIRVAGFIWRSYYSDLQLLLVGLFIMVFFGGSVLYFVENFNRTSADFDSIPNSLWWAAMTVTNVGYGDIIPITVMGRILASAFMIMGVVTMSLPLLSLVIKFSTYYERNINLEKPVPSYSF